MELSAEEFAALREMAIKGIRGTEFTLGMAYRVGMGAAEKNLEEAIKWLRRGAEHGDLRAQSAVGFMYFFGQGVEKNQTEGAKWLRIAAERGDAEAQAILGALLAHGIGIKQDVIDALAWLSLAGETLEIARAFRANFEQTMEGVSEAEVELRRQKLTQQIRVRSLEEKLLDTAAENSPAI